MLDKKERYNSLDLCKWFMAVFVIAIHTHPLDAYASETVLTIYNAIVNIAVPIFFIISGFLLFNKMDGCDTSKENLTRIKNYFFKILKRYCIWTVIYLPLTIYYYIINGKSIYYNIFYFFRGFLLRGENFYSWPLWYLLSLLFSLVIIGVLIKKGFSEKVIFIVSFLVFIFGNLMSYFVMNMDHFTGLFRQIIEKYQFFFNDSKVFTGPLYVTIGMLLAKHALHLSKSTSIILIILGLLANIFFPPVLSSLGLVLSAVMLFVLVVHIKLPDSKWWKAFRKSSTVMYFTHMIFAFSYAFIRQKTLPYHGLDVFFFSLICTLFLSFVVLKLEKRKCFQWLKEIF